MFWGAWLRPSTSLSCPILEKSTSSWLYLTAAPAQAFRDQSIRCPSAALFWHGDSKIPEIQFRIVLVTLYYSFR